jgi:phosphate uptake regulator/aminoglycoside phosphotransferase (APT) family kinase protein
MLKSLEENFKFIVIEVTKQVEDTLRVLDNPGDRGLIHKIHVRDDYIDRLKSFIENKRNAYILSNDGIDKTTMDYTQAISVITRNLEHLADHAVNIADQTQFLEDGSFIKRYDYRDLIKEVLQALKGVRRGLQKRDVTLALTMCRLEPRFDKVYGGVFDRITEELRSGEQVRDLLTVLLIFQYFERMGDSILNIGEAIISAVTGERIKIQQYEALGRNLPESNGAEELDGIRIEQPAETRSGAHVSKVKPGQSVQLPRWVIFKEGKTDKIAREKESIDLWESLFPGLPPRIYGFERNGANSSLLLEYLGGRTLKQVVFSRSRTEVAQAMSALTAQVETIWDSTCRDTEAEQAYVAQMYARIGDVYKVHPSYRTPAKSLGDIEIPPFEEILSRAAEIDRQLKAPFSVLIHGDFNIDNIMFDQRNKRIHFIDVYRSAYADYVQDVSVFLLSNIRLPVVNGRVRRNIHGVIRDFYDFGADYAARTDDRTFQARLALGMARSYLTSTRFALDHDAAKGMYLRAVYLLERLLEHGDGERNWENFTLAGEILLEGI